MIWINPSVAREANTKGCHIQDHKIFTQGIERDMLLQDIKLCAKVIIFILK